MRIGYLEIVSSNVDATCNRLARQHDVTFTPPVEALGGARTTSLEDGTKLGVRPPLRSDEDPIVRPYWLVEDIEAELQRVEADGATVAHPVLALEGQGIFAIYILDGIQHGLWQH